MRTLDDVLANHGTRSLATRSGAERRLARIAALVPQSIGFVHVGADGRFTPVVLIRPDETAQALPVAMAGVFVMN